MLSSYDTFIMDSMINTNNWGQLVIDTQWYIGQDKGWISAFAEEHHSH